MENDLAKKKAIFFLKMIFSATLLYLIIAQINTDEISEAFSKSDFKILSIVFALSFFNIYLQFAKWKIISASYLNENNNSKIFKSLMMGFAAGILTPARVGEFAGRAYPLRNKDITAIAVATFLDKIIAMIFIFLIGFASAFYLFGDKIIFSSGSVLIFIIAATIFLGALVLINRKRKEGFRNIISLKNLFTKISHLKKLERKLFFKLSLVSFVFVMIYLFQFSLLISAFTGIGDYVLFFWVGASVMFTKTFLLPFGFGDLGVREGAAVYFLSLLGYSGAAGFSASILLFVVNLLIPAFIGLIFFLKK